MTSKAIVCHAPEDLRLDAFQDAQEATTLGPHQLAVRVAYGGICGLWGYGAAGWVVPRHNGHAQQIERVAEHVFDGHGGLPFLRLPAHKQRDQRCVAHLPAPVPMHLFVEGGALGQHTGGIKMFTGAEHT